MYPEHGHASGDDPATLGASQLMLHRLGRDDELLYKPDNPASLPGLRHAAGCSSTSTTSHSATPPHALVTR